MMKCPKCEAEMFFLTTAYAVHCERCKTRFIYGDNDEGEGIWSELPDNAEDR